MRTINEISGADIKGMFDMFADAYKAFDFSAYEGRDIPICDLIDRCRAVAVKSERKCIREARRGTWKLIILMLVNAMENGLMDNVLHDLCRIMERDDGSILVSMWQGSRKIEKTFWGWNPDERGMRK